MRGVDGFYFWGGDGEHAAGGYVANNYWSATDSQGNHLNPWYHPNEEWNDQSSPLNGAEWFEAHALISWETLDSTYSDDAVVYRLDTNKESGVVVSAMNDMGQLTMLVSFMKPIPLGSTNVDIESYFHQARDYTSGSGTQSLSVTEYSHTIARYFFTPDVDGDFDADLNDTLLWGGLYTSLDPRADWNQDGYVDSDDLDLFIAASIAY